MSQKAQAATKIAAHTHKNDSNTSETYQDHNLQMRAAMESRGALDIIQAMRWVERHPVAWTAIAAKACRMTNRDGKASMIALMGWARVEFGKSAPIHKNLQPALAYLLETEFPAEIEFRHRGARCRGWY